MESTLTCGPRKIDNISLFLSTNSNIYFNSKYGSLGLGEGVVCDKITLSLLLEFL